MSRSFERLVAAGLTGFLAFSLVAMPLAMLGLFRPIAVLAGSAGVWILLYVLWGPSVTRGVRFDARATAVVLLVVVAVTGLNVRYSSQHLLTERDPGVTLVLTAGYTGMRWGELAGLRPAGVNLLRRHLRITEQLTEVAGRFAWGPPKTAAGVRTVSLPPFLVERLGDQLALPVVVGSGLVFPATNGEPMRRSNFRRRVWGRAIRKVGLEGVRFHDLRHTAVALAIAQGTHPKAIQERLGHSSIRMTLDRYGHLFPTLDEEVATGLEKAFRDSLAGTARESEGSAVIALASSEGSYPL